MIQSVVRAIDILETVYRQPEGEAGLVDIARALNLDKSTVYNLIKTLKSKEFISQDKAGGKYSLGSRLLELARGELDEAHLNRIALPFCEELFEKAGESISLVVFLKGELRPICRLLSQSAVVAQPGNRKPLYSTASGRSLLAQLDADSLKTIVKIYGYPGQDWDNISSLKELTKELAAIKSEKFAVVISDEREVAALAAFVEAPASYGPMALAAFLPNYRFNSSKKKELSRLLKEYSEKISLLLRQV